MSITSVSSKIKAAMNDSFITTAEAKTIVKEAEKGPVTIGEAKLVAALFDKAPRPPIPGMMMTMAIPENPGDVFFEGGARNVLELFFTKNNVPAGQNLTKYVSQIEAKLDEAGWGEPLATPPDLKKLHIVPLPYPEGANDFPGRTAFVDTKKNEFYLKVSGGLMAPNAANTRWFGPTSLTTATTLTDARKALVQSKLDEGKANASWSIQSDLMNVRTVKVELASDDIYNYTALVPVGMTNPEPALDPNGVNDVVIMRMPKIIPPNVRIAPEYAQFNLLPGNHGHGPREPAAV